MSCAAPVTLSIITVCKNQAEDIALTCASVAGQTWKDFEWIVVDGASGDGTQEVLSRWRDSMTAYVSEPDTGVYNAMNKGLRRASGRWVLFLNGGDRLAADSTLAEVFRQEYGEDVLFGDEIREGKKKTSGYVSVPRGCPFDKLFFACHTIPHQSAFIRRELFDRCGPYDENYNIAGDWEKWIVFAARGCMFRHLEMVVSIFKKGGMSANRSYKERQDAEMAGMLQTHFSVAELVAAKELEKKYSGRRVIRTILPLGKYALFTVEERFDKVKTIYRLFGLPVLKARKIAHARRRWYLFCCIPLFNR